MNDQAEETSGPDAEPYVSPIRQNHRDIERGKWIKFLSGFLGWFMISTLAIEFLSGSWAAAILYWVIYLPINLIVIVILGWMKRTRWIAFGIVGAMVTNFLVAAILGTYLSPFSFVPVTHPEMYRFRRNFRVEQIGHLFDCDKYNGVYFIRAGESVQTCLLLTVV